VLSGLPRSLSGTAKKNLAFKFQHITFIHGAQDQVGLQLQNSSELEVFDLHGYCLGIKHDLGLHFVVLQTLLTAYLTAYCLVRHGHTTVSDDCDPRVLAVLPSGE